MIAFRISSLILLAMSLAWSGPVSAATAPMVVRLYSDMCVHPESGDLLGTRIMLLDLNDGPYLIFQEAEGAMGMPEIVRLERGALEGKALNFAVGPKHSRFHGRLRIVKSPGASKTGGWVRQARPACFSSAWRKLKKVFRIAGDGWARRLPKHDEWLPGSSVL
jgi:hypothetical protein